MGRVRRTGRVFDVGEVGPVYGRFVIEVSLRRADADLLCHGRERIARLTAALGGLADWADQHVSAVDVEPLLVSAHAALAADRPGVTQ